MTDTTWGPGVKYGTVITDASLCPKTKAMGWAAWLATGSARETKRYQKSGIHLPGAQTSSIAEFIAAMHGLQLAAKIGVTHALLQSDCKHVIRVLGDKQYKRLGTLLTGATGTPPEIKEMMIELRDLQVMTKWVKGHHVSSTARSWVQDWCDRHAKERMLVRRKEIADGKA